MIESQLIIPRLDIFHNLINTTICIGGKFNNLFVFDEIAVKLSITDFDFWIWNPSFNLIFCFKDALLAFASWFCKISIHYQVWISWNWSRSGQSGLSSCGKIRFSEKANTLDESSIAVVLSSIWTELKIWVSSRCHLNIDNFSIDSVINWCDLFEDCLIERYWKHAIIVGSEFSGCVIEF